MNCLSIKDVNCQGKKVLLRVDFNVPFDAQGKITDSTRIKESLPTIQYLLQQKASLILLSHRGRPQGKDPAYTLKPCADALSELLNQPVFFTTDCLGPATAKKIANLHPGELLLLENLRFHEAEEKPDLDPSFAKILASYGDFYVNDAFSASHRAHSSIVPLAQAFPFKAAAGLLLEKEIKTLSHMSKSPTPPFHLLLVGSKISSKLPVIKALLPKVQALYIGGGMAFTFLKALGFSIGNSCFEPEFEVEAQKILQHCQEKKIDVFLPI